MGILVQINYAIKRPANTGLFLFFLSISKISGTFAVE